MLALLAALALVVYQPAVQELRVLSPAEMQEDLFQLTEKLTSLHSGLHRYASEDEIDAAFGAALSEAEGRPRDVLSFYRLVSELVAKVRCGHTRVRIGERDRAAALARRGVLPFEVLLRGERAWIRRVLVEGTRLENGRELLAIDGLTYPEIRRRAFARLSDDGFIESGKERDLEAGFAEKFALLVAEASSGPYELRPAGATEPVRVAGIPADELAKKRGTPPERPLVHLELRPEAGVGLLSIQAFGDPPAGEPGFLAGLEQSFRTLREQKVPHLILDLRGNSGGRDMYGAMLVSYLATAPFGYFERIEVTPDYEGDVRIVERGSRRLMLSHDGLQVQLPAEFHFHGDVCILIDGITFSTAADVATVAHANHLATFLGEETGGGYEGNNSGDSLNLVLRNSHFTIGIQHWNYTTAGVGPGHHGRGVVPDVAVSSTIEDELAGRDTVLERALEHVREAAKR